MSLGVNPAADHSRYARQVRFPPLGEEGQRRLGLSQALLCGCGRWAARSPNPGPGGRGHAADRRSRFRRAEQPPAADRCSTRPTREPDCPRPWPPPKSCGDQFHCHGRADRGRRRAGERRTVLRRNGRDPRRDRQFRDAVSHQRRGREARAAVGLWRLRRGGGADDDHSARRNGLPALPDAGVPRAGQHAHLRSGRHPRPDRRA